MKTTNQKPIMITIKGHDVLMNARVPKSVAYYIMSILEEDNEYQEPKIDL